MDKILSAIEQMEGRPKEELRELFCNAPVWLLEECRIIELKKGEVLVREKDKVQFVYILIKGIVKACDFRILGIAYEFCHYEAVEILGGMELFVDTTGYMTTLITETPCRFLVIHREKFEEWMRSDCHALWIHTSHMTEYLLRETRKERAYLFLQGIDRVYLFLEHLYEQNAENGCYIVKITRQQISDETGLSIKTINRSLKQMALEGMIGIEGRQLQMTEEQYNRMKEYTAEKIDV